MAAIFEPNAGHVLKRCAGREKERTGLARNGKEPGCRKLDLRRNPRWKVAVWRTARLGRSSLTSTDVSGNRARQISVAGTHPLDRAPALRAPSVQRGHTLQRPVHKTRKECSDVRRRLRHSCRRAACAGVHRRILCVCPPQASIRLCSTRFTVSTLAARSADGHRSRPGRRHWPWLHLCEIPNLRLVKPSPSSRILHGVYYSATAAGTSIL